MDLCVMTLAAAIVLIDQIVAIEDPVQLVELIKIKHFISCSIFDEILQGVNFLHTCDNPIIHRDLKPSNIMLTDGINGRFVKITDFGMSTFHLLTDQSHTDEPGTREYRAPEAYHSKYDTKADMFSIGRILYELLAIKRFNVIKNDKYFIMKSKIQFFSLSDKGNQMSEINPKYWTKLFKSLTEWRPELRPSCHSIIMERDEWFYELKKIRELNIVNQICNQTDCNYAFEKDFKEYFIYQKKDTNQTSLKTSNEVILSLLTLSLNKI